ncbi:MAG TPA: GNAT family N-acetyltransferase [Parvibaculum sp.]
MPIRDYRPADAEVLTQLFHDTVHATGLRTYSAAQVAAWSPAPPDAARWHARMSARHTLVAEENDVILGFAELEESGHFDMLYVAKAAIGTGVGGALCDAVEDRARELGIARLFTEASKLARPVFEKRGYMLVAEQTVTPNGVPLTNYRMEKFLR